MRTSRACLLTIALLIFAFSQAFGAEVCRLRGLQGFEEPARRAELLIPNAKTSDQAKAVVYIEKTAEGYYYHSNFITPGYDYPTKVGSEAATDGAAAFVNIVHAGRPSDAAWAQTERTFRDNVEVLVDTSVFDKNGAPMVDLSGVKNVKIVNGRSGRVVVPKVETLSRNQPPPLMLRKILGCCFFGIPPHLAQSYGEALRARPFQQSEVRFLSLVKDSATDSAINKSSLIKDRRLGGGEQISKLADIERSFQNARGKTVVLVGHVEGSNFVARNAKKEVVLNVPIASLRSTARKYDVELIDLGCRTAQEITKDSLGLGVSTRFNTVDAVNSIDLALSRSKNYAEFFENLTSEGLKVVVDREFVNGSALRASIYSAQKTQRSPFWVKIAEVFVSFRRKG